MATLSTTNPTLADVTSRMTADGKIDPQIVELLAETNEILEDMTVLEANGFTEHKTTVRSGLPQGTWRMLNYGVQPEKSRTVPVKDSMGMLETYAEVDKALADLNGNSAAWRLSEDRAFIEGLNQTMANTLFYGNSSLEPEKFMGLAPRYSEKAAENGQNIIDAGGTGSDNTSIWLVVWSPNTVHTIYPKGSKAGLQSRDLGEDTLTDAAGGRYQGYRTHYKWDIGAVLRDWRFVVRIANIDASDLAAGTGPDLLTLMAKALHRVPNLQMGRAVFYANRAVHEALDIQSMGKNGLALKTQELEGKFWQTFRGVPIRTVDALLNTEARVV
ncbi:major capsid protein [Brachymonas sp. J145]|uniref:major capsid protein n=1 Tax=Brachymonas sp. J145 TaxID=3116489 RepID=UPI002E77494B|nr:hypothetical protein [Brachymonas sp. J145]MEE1653740.1 hypothetical protein [Brachymonas sp. J145]